MQAEGGGRTTDLRLRPSVGCFCRAPAGQDHHQRKYPKNYLHMDQPAKRLRIIPRLNPQLSHKDGSKDHSIVSRRSRPNPRAHIPISTSPSTEETLPFLSLSQFEHLAPQRNNVHLQDQTRQNLRYSWPQHFLQIQPLMIGWPHCQVMEWLGQLGVAVARSCSPRDNVIGFEFGRGHFRVEMGLGPGPACRDTVLVQIPAITARRPNRFLGGLRTGLLIVVRG